MIQERQKKGEYDKIRENISLIYNVKEIKYRSVFNKKSCYMYG